METRLPAPALVVLVGPSASGKTTWADQHFAPNEIVSSDALRAMAGTGPDDQAAGTAAFDLLGQIVGERLRRGLTTVIDTLGYDPERRAEWIGRAAEFGIPAFAVLFDTPSEECERRNAERSRPVPKAVLRKQITRFRKEAAAIADEGFDGVLTEQTVAVVAPQFIQDATEPSAAPPTHTFGLLVSRFDWPGERDERAVQLASVARRAEAVGFRDLWVMDHFRQIRSVGRHWEDIPESFTALAYLAGVTETIRLGVLVAGITYRNPAHLGKIVATLDVLSGGRANCGIGAAWDEAEHRAYGWEFPPPADRYALVEDTLRLLPLLWGKGAPSFQGKVLRADELICYPRPVQEHIPILLGGSGERTTLRLVAEYADACNVFGSPDRVRHKVGVLEQHCLAVERDPATIEVTHLANALAATDRNSLRDRVEELRGRNTTAENFAAAHNAGTPGDLIALFTAYAAAGASHSIVAMPDVHLEGGVEAFGEVIGHFA